MPEAHLALAILQQAVTDLHVGASIDRDAVLFWLGTSDCQLLCELIGIPHEEFIKRAMDADQWQPKRQRRSLAKTPNSSG